MAAPSSMGSIGAGVGELMLLDAVPRVLRQVEAGCTGRQMSGDELARREVATAMVRDSSHEVACAAQSALEVQSRDPCIVQLAVDMCFQETQANPHSKLGAHFRVLDTAQMAGNTCRRVSCSTSFQTLSRRPRRAVRLHHRSKAHWIHERLVL